MDMYLLVFGFFGLLIVALFQINELQESQQELRDMQEVLLIQKQSEKMNITIMYDPLTHKPVFIKNEKVIDKKDDMSYNEFMLFQYCLDSESLENAKYMLKDYKEK